MDSSQKKLSKLFKGFCMDIYDRKKCFLLFITCDAYDK